MLTNEERETILLMNAASDMVDVGTFDPVFLGKLDKLCAEYPDVYRRQGYTPRGEICYVFPKKLLRFGKPASEARREAGRRAADLNLRTRKLLNSSGLQPSP